MEIVGQIISGEHGSIMIRQKAGEELELGELLYAEDSRVIMEITNLKYGSMLSQDSLEMVSGLQLEGLAKGASLIEKELRNYVLAEVQALAKVQGDAAIKCKTLPQFFSHVRRIEQADLTFLGKPEKSIFMGNLRSGSRIMPAKVYIDAEDALSHHILVPASTGKGKSNLIKVMLYDLVDKDFAGVLVLDAHDEYYGRNSIGLKDHPEASEYVRYYSNSGCHRSNSLKIPLTAVEPAHFKGVVDFSEAQVEAIQLYYNRYSERWVEELLKSELPFDKRVQDVTLFALQRRLGNLLAVKVDESGAVAGYGKIFAPHVETNTVKNIITELEQAKTVVVDLSLLSERTGLLIGSIIASEAMERYRMLKAADQLREKPNISVLIEEAPRVLGKDVLRFGGNTFSAIAREGRKFKVGLIAITQLCSEIPREILANMNTKIIMGNEMQLERQAVIESASQDLSRDSNAIASLDKGEAIVTSNFLPFAVPIKAPLFDKAYTGALKSHSTKRAFIG